MNYERRDRLIGRMREVLWNLEGKRVAVWGLSFKPNTDDLRDAPALRLIQGLLEAGCHVAVYDPVVAADEIVAIGADVTMDSYAAAGAHAVVLCTEWDEFRTIDLQRVGRLMEQKVLFDGRNLFDPIDAVGAGFVYAATGRPIRYPRRPELPAAADGAVVPLASVVVES